MSGGVFIAGPPAACSRCQSANLVLLDESFDEIDEVCVGEVRCYDCLCEMVYARREGAPVPGYFLLGSVDDVNERGGVMQLFEMEKIGVFCDSFKPRLQKKRDHSLTLVDVTLRIEPLTAEQAATVAGNGFMKKSLFNLSHGTPVSHVKGMEFDFEVPRQQIHIFAAPDVDQPSLVFDQVDITKVRARMAKARWCLIFHATFGPAGKTELEALNGWYMTQRFLTFKEASPSLEFEEGTEADTKARKKAAPRDTVPAVLAPGGSVPVNGPEWEPEGEKVLGHHIAGGREEKKPARGRPRGPRRLPAVPAKKGPGVH